MYKRLFFLLMLISVIGLFWGCDPTPPSIESSEALILSYTSGYIVGTPAIDAVNKTVAVTVKPMDLSGFTPEITVSENATVILPSSIQDGVEAVYRVTAENGDVAEWKVTITVQYGITFNIDGTVLLLTCGFSDSLDETQDVDLGSGVPGIVKYSTDSVSYIFKQVHDLGLYPDPPTDNPYCNFNFDGTSTGTDTGSLYLNNFDDDYPSFDLTITASKFGTIGGDYVASFTGTDGGKVIEPGGESRISDIPPARAISLTGGFAKLKIVKSGPGGGGE